MAVPPEAICPGPAADPNTYEYVLCAARSLSHLFNKSTGRLMGEAASKADCSSNVCFSNRPFGVKHFQTPSMRCRCRLRALASLRNRHQGPSTMGSKTRRNNLLVGLAVRRTAGPSGHTNSPHPSSREGHPSTARWISSFPPMDLILRGFHAATVACSLVQRNSVPSTQMRCMITASRRARATIAFFIPRRLAICMAHALSQDHFFECIML
jgi:hypothetical protein